MRHWLESTHWWLFSEGWILGGRSRIVIKLTHIILYIKLFCPYLVSISNRFKGIYLIIFIGNKKWNSLPMSIFLKWYNLSLIETKPISILEASVQWLLYSIWYTRDIKYQQKSLFIYNPMPKRYTYLYNMGTSNKVLAQHIFQIVMPINQYIPKSRCWHLYLAMACSHTSF